MKLYYLPGACSLAPHIVLNWLGKPYETHRLARDELKQPEYLRINPMGAVPALTEGDWTLTQNVAILEFLAESDTSKHLLGTGGARDRAEVRRWLAFVNADVHKAFGLVFGVKQWLPDEAGQQTLQESAIKKIGNMFDIVDKHLEGRNYLVGDNATIADAYLYVVLRWAQAKKLDLVKLNNIGRFFERMQADPAVQSALKDEGLA